MGIKDYKCCVKAPGPQRTPNMLLIGVFSVCILVAHSASLKREDEMLPAWKRFDQFKALRNAFSKNTRELTANNQDDLNKIVANFTATMKEMESMADAMEHIPEMTFGLSSEELVQQMAQLEKYMAEFETSLANINAMRKKRNAGRPGVAEFPGTMPNYGDMFDMSMVAGEVEGMKANLTAAMKELENMSSLMIAMQLREPGDSLVDMSEIMGEIDNVMANFTASMMDLDTMSTAMKNGGGLDPNFLQQLNIKYNGEPMQKRSEIMTGSDDFKLDWEKIAGTVPDSLSPDFSKLFPMIEYPLTGTESGMDFDNLMSGFDGMMANFSKSMETLKGLGIQFNETVPVHVYGQNNQPETSEFQDALINEIEQINNRLEVLEKDVAGLKDNNKETQIGQEQFGARLNPQSFPPAKK